MNKLSDEPFHLSKERPENTVEIVIVGNELLSGTTLDTNSHWLTQQLTNLGFLVRRKTTIRDDLGEISGTFKEVLSRKPAWVISIGGLGPTFDDMTLLGLARSLGKVLEINPKALEQLKERYRNRAKLYGKKYSRITKASLKMVTLPRGSEPLKNTEGSAPGVLTESRGGTKIVSLPGVPREMKAIFLQELKPMLEKVPGRIRRFEQWLYIEGVSESKIAPCVHKIVKESSQAVYVKSHPFGFKKGKSLIKVQFIAQSENEQDSLKLLDRACTKLIQNIKSLGGAARFIRRRSI